MVKQRINERTWWCLEDGIAQCWSDSRLRAVLTTTIKNFPAQSLSHVHFRPSISAVLMINKSPMRQVV